MGGRLLTWAEGTKGEWLDPGTADAGNGVGGSRRYQRQMRELSRKSQAWVAGSEFQMHDRGETTIDQRRLIQIAQNIYEEELATLATELPVPSGRTCMNTTSKKQVRWAPGVGREESESNDRPSIASGTVYGC